MRAPWLHIILYRLWRLKRLVVIVPTIIALAALIAGHVGGIHSAYLMPEAIVRTTAIALVLTMVLVVALPAPAFDHLTLGLTAAIFVAAEPWHGQFFAPEFKGGAFTPDWLKAMMFVSYGLIAWGGLVFVWAMIAKMMPPRRRPYRYALNVPGADPDLLRGLLGIHPGATLGRLTFGEKGWDGYVPATLNLRGHDPETLKMSDIAFEYRTRLVDSDEASDTYDLRFPDDAQGERQVKMTYLPHGDGTRIEVTETPGHPDRLVNVSFFLAETGADCLRARVDTVLDRPAIANILAPQRSLLMMLGRLMRMPSLKKKVDPAPS